MKRRQDSTLKENIVKNIAGGIPRSHFAKTLSWAKYYSVVLRKTLSIPYYETN